MPGPSLPRSQALANRQAQLHKDSPARAPQRGRCSACNCVQQRSATGGLNERQIAGAGCQHLWQRAARAAQPPGCGAGRGREPARHDACQQVMALHRIIRLGRLHPALCCTPSFGYFTRWLSSLASITGSGATTQLRRCGAAHSLLR